MPLYPELSETFRIQRLEPPQGPIQMVLDTDTYNEIDDQFAVVQTLLSPEKLKLQAIYAAPFFNTMSSGPKDGMERSYDEILHILNRMNISADQFVYRGSETYLPQADTPVDSPAARDLVARAMAAPDDEPLYVVAIGAITNVASAILLEPQIIRKIVVVWLGGHGMDWGNTREFNLEQDVAAARVIFDSGVPLMLVPCMGVSSHLLTTLSEVNQYVRGQGAIGDFLAERYEGCAPDHFGYSRVIWDISTIAWLLDGNFVPSHLIHSPVLTDQVTWSVDHARHMIRCAKWVNRDLIFQDLFRKLADHAAANKGAV